MTSKTTSAFTLIELLFVVGTIAILAAISVPNFLEAQVRAKIARTKVDMSVISVGLNRYYADYGAYPSNTTETQTYLTKALQYSNMRSLYTSGTLEGGKIPVISSREFSEKYSNPKVLQDNERQLYLLTTPVAYLESTLPVDTFAEQKYMRPLYFNSYDVFANDTATTHPGLWGDHLTSSTYTVLASSGPDRDLELWHPLNGPWISYDATNGTVSSGNFLSFEGRQPKPVAPDPQYDPEQNVNYPNWDPMILPM